MIQSGCRSVKALVPTTTFTSATTSTTSPQGLRHAVLRAPRLWIDSTTTVSTSPSRTRTRRTFSTLSSSSSSSFSIQRHAVPTRVQSSFSSFDDASFLEESASSLHSGYARPVVQWYPGHIAKAERQLQETLKAVDVIVEVRDARAAKATSHPMVGSWCAGKPRLVVLTHVDQIPTIAQRGWKKAYDLYGAEHPEQALLMDRQVQNQAKQAFKERLKYTTTPSEATTTKTVSSSPTTDVLTAVESVLFVNGKTGQGVPALTRAIFKAGAHVQERRSRRGLKQRNLRVGIIGYPNVGKSALINRLLNRKRAKTANTPGVTRSLQWIRVRNDDHLSSSSGKTNISKKKEFELLDSPGIIPATLVDQSDATLLAAINCIGQAAYDNQAVAAYLCEWLLSLYRLDYGNKLAPEWRTKCQERYKLDPLEDIPCTVDPTKLVPRTGEDMLFAVADNTCQGDPEDAARKILQDFRQGRLGPISLQVPPESETDQGQRRVLSKDGRGTDFLQDTWEQQRQELEQEREQARLQAMAAAKERGLELPPTVTQEGDGVEEKADNDSATKKKEIIDASDVGKGLFEGW